MIKPDKETFGDWLKRKREEANITPTDLANEAGLTAAYIGKLEKNVRTPNGSLPQPTIEVVDRLARALKLSVWEARSAAGYIPEDVPESEIKARIAADYVYALPEDKQDEALANLKFLFEKYGDKGRMRERSPKNSGVVQEGESHPEPVAQTPPQLEGSPRKARKRADENTDSERTAKNGSENRR